MFGYKDTIPWLFITKFLLWWTLGIVLTICISVHDNNYVSNFWLIYLFVNCILVLRKFSPWKFIIKHAKHVFQEIHGTYVHVMNLMMTQTCFQTFLTLQLSSNTTGLWVRSRWFNLKENQCLISCQHMLGFIVEVWMKNILC